MSRRPCLHDEGHVYHLYVIEVEDRERVQRRCANAASRPASTIRFRFICSRPTPISGSRRGAFRAPNAAPAGMLSLPMFAELTEEQIEFVVDALASCAAAVVA